MPGPAQGHVRTIPGAASSIQAPVQSFTNGEVVAIPKPNASLTDDPNGPKFSQAWYRFLSNQFSAVFSQSGGGNSGSSGGVIPGGTSVVTQINAANAFQWLGPV